MGGGGGGGGGGADKPEEGIPIGGGGGGGASIILQSYASNSQLLVHNETYPNKPLKKSQPAQVLISARLKDSIQKYTYQVFTLAPVSFSRSFFRNTLVVLNYTLVNLSCPTGLELQTSPFHLLQNEKKNKTAHSALTQQRLISLDSRPTPLAFTDCLRSTPSKEDTILHPF